MLQRQCKPNAIEIFRIAEVQPVFANFCKGTTHFLQLGCKLLISPNNHVIVCPLPVLCFRILLQKKFVFFLHFRHLFCIFAVRKVVPKAIWKPQTSKSFGDRRKTFARTPQQFAPPAASICHGRGKFVILSFSSCFNWLLSPFQRGPLPYSITLRRC